MLTQVSLLEWLQWQVFLNFTPSCVLPPLAGMRVPVSCASEQRYRVSYPSPAWQAQMKFAVWLGKHATFMLVRANS